MTLPASGPISFNAINVELGVAGTTSASLGQTSYRTLAGVPSGAISMSNFYGKSNRVAVSYTFTGTTANASLNVTTIAGYVAGRTDVTVTVNPGVYLYASSGSYPPALNPGLTLSGGTSGDTVTLVNNGYIMGQGGDSGYTSGGAGYSGGPALSIGYPITINNTNGSAYIGGGGGGGGSSALGQGGGGAGGGRANSGNSNGGSPGQNGQGGSATTGITASTCNGAGGGGGGAYSTGAKGATTYYGPGSSGGRIFPGSTGLGAVSNSGASGGNGGGANAAGGTGNFNGGGGGWGANGGAGGGGSIAGGAGGKAVSLNGHSVTWVSGNTSRVYGGVS